MHQHASKFQEAAPTLNPAAPTEPVTHAHDDIAPTSTVATSSNSIPVYNLPVVNRFGTFDIDERDDDLDIVDCDDLLPTKHTQYSVDGGLSTAPISAAALVGPDGRANQSVASAILAAKKKIDASSVDSEDPKRQKVGADGEAEQLG